MRSPKTITARKKAAIAADLALGLTYNEVAKKHKVSKGSVVNISAQFNKTIFDVTKKIESHIETRQEILLKRREDFQLELMDFLQSAVSMVKKWTEICQDEDFVREKPLGANELGRTALDFADRIVARTTSQSFEHEPTNFNKNSN